MWMTYGRGKLERPWCHHLHPIALNQDEYPPRIGTGSDAGRGEWASSKPRTSQDWNGESLEQAQATILVLLTAKQTSTRAQA